MAPAQIYSRNATCVEWTCPAYFTEGVITNCAVTLVRVVFCIFVLLLGFKMPPDFMRTVTMAVFIPIAAGEVFNLYEEIVGYLNYFQTTSEFQTNYVDWTPPISIVFYDYIHYDVMLMLIVGLHCCRICIRDDESIFVFPVKMISIVLQIVPLFLCLLSLVPSKDANIVVKIIDIVSKLTTFVCFIIITVQIAYSLYLVSRELPYDHAACTDMQIRDARSRLAWYLGYMVIPYVSMIPYFLESIVWMIRQGEGPKIDVQNPNASGLDQLSEEELNDPIVQWTAILQIMESLIDYYRPAWMIILTCFFLPPYRRAVPLLCCCLPCCPTIQVEPLPRKPKEMSTMYKDAD